MSLVFADDELVQVAVRPAHGKLDQHAQASLDALIRVSQAHAAAEADR